MAHHISAHENLNYRKHQRIKKISHQQDPYIRSLLFLLMTNLLYALVLPVVEIFVGAYVMRHTSEPVSVAFYQLFIYIGIITTSFVNGFLLRHVSSLLFEELILSF